MPTLAVLHKLATALGTTMAELLAEVESDGPSTSEPAAIPHSRVRTRTRLEAALSQDTADCRAAPSAGVSGPPG